MCECEIFSENGFNVCKKCGVSTRFLDPNLQSYADETRYMYCKRSYSRTDRFKRLLLNLNGLQWVDHDILKQCEPHFTSVIALKRWMATTPLKRHRNKIASICRQLGMKWKILTDLEIKFAQELFHKNHSKSYLVLLPYVLKRIGRDDLLQFTKIPSIAVQKKHNIFIKC